MALEALPSPQGTHSRNGDAVIDGMPLPGSQPASPSKPANSHQSSQASEPVGLSYLPVELVVKIFGQLDVPGAFNLAMTCKRFKSIFNVHLEAIVLPILTRELSPAEGLLQAITVSPDDLKDQKVLCLRRKILHGSKVVCPGEWAYDESTTTVIEPVTMTLNLGHFKRLLSLNRIAKGWEQLISEYRIPRPEDRRALLPHELKRVRGALYHWMSYAYYFHGNLPRPNTWVPFKQSADPRCNWMRLLSDVQLHEFEDMWKTVRIIVGDLICPSLEYNKKTMGRDKTKEEIAKASFGSAAGVLPPGLTSWSEDAQWYNYHGGIVDTFLKLPPDLMLHYIDNRHMYPKEKLICDVLDKFPNIEEDVETLSYALSAVQAERRDKRIAAQHSAAPGEVRFDPTPQHWDGQLRRWNHSGGILDWVSVDDRAIRAYWDQRSDRELRLDPRDATMPHPEDVMHRGMVDVPPRAASSWSA